MHIELPLVGLFATLLMFFNGVMLILYRRINPCFDGVRWWISGLVLWALCYLLFSLRFHVSSLWLTTFLPNLLCIAFGICFLRGVCRFRGRPFPHKIVTGLTLLTVGWYAAFLFVWPDFLVRAGIMAGCMGGFNCLIVWVLLRPWPHGYGLSHGAAAAIHNIMAVNEFVRMVRAFSLPAAGEVISMDPVIMGSLMINSLLVTPLTAFACVLLIGQRQVTESRRTERELHEARVRLAEQELVRQKQTLLRDLHDGLSGTITAIVLNCRHLTGRGSGADDEVLQAIRQLAAMSNHEIRGMMHRVGSESLLWNELQAELHNFADALLQASAIQLIWHTSPPPDLPITDIAAASSFTRMVKESIHNVLRHSGSRTAEVSWLFEVERLKLTIKDTGAGLGAAHVAGRGLRHMSLRAEELGGEVSFLSGTASGLAVVIDLPLPLSLIPHV